MLLMLCIRIQLWMEQPGIVETEPGHGRVWDWMSFKGVFPPKPVHNSYLQIPLSLASATLANLPPLHTTLSCSSYPSNFCLQGCEFGLLPWRIIKSLLFSGCCRGEVTDTWLTSLWFCSATHTSAHGHLIFPYYGKTPLDLLRPKHRDQ